MKEILIATGNPGKFHEIKGALGGDFELLSLKDYEGRVGEKLGEPIEDGEIFQENAYKKAKYFFDKISGDKVGIWVLAEDSGILVDALRGELGVKTRRWGAGEKASDQEWIDFFMDRMRGFPDRERGAKFVCVACLIGWKDGKEFVKYFEGETGGVITRNLEAPIFVGVPLSSCFRPEAFQKVYAALDVEEKNRISHRGKAMAEAKNFLCSL